MGAETIVEAAITRLHRHRHWIRCGHLRVDLEQVAHVRTDGRIVESRQFLGARNKPQAAILERGILQRNPDGN